METPSSARIVTRSQTKGLSSSASNNIVFSKKGEESELGTSKSTQKNPAKQDRSALIDITNDSPIVGLATGSSLLEETPLSSVAKRRRNLIPKNNSTPGSGEALLRGQVKTLLQKVEEEEVEMISKFSLDSHGEDERRPFLALKSFLNSPHMGGRILLAPTPANTPQVSGGVLENNGRDRVFDASVVAGFPIGEQVKISEVVNGLFEGQTAESCESDKCVITRSLLLDFSDKSEISNAESSGYSSSSVASTICHGTADSSKDKSVVSSLPDEDDASIWSIQVNASTQDESELVEDDEHGNDDDEGECYNDAEGESYDDEDVGDYEYDDDDDDEQHAEDDGWVDELCEGMSRISVQCTGKHTRFVYNSDDEIVGEADEEGDVIKFKDGNDGEVVKLKGLPTPKGKHLRFKVDEEDE